MQVATCYARQLHDQDAVLRLLRHLQGKIKVSYVNFTCLPFVGAWGGLGVLRRLR
jgi:hypothetical protein